MDLNEFILNIDKQRGTKDYILFETFVLKLLKKYLDEQNKPFSSPYYKTLSNGYSRIEYDGFAEKGIDDLEGPTIVEIKLLRGGNSFIIRKLSETLIKFANNKESNSILLIVGSVLSNESKTKIYQLENIHNIVIRLWDLNDLQNLSERYPKLTSDVISNLSEIVVQNTILDSINNDPNRWKAKREEYLDKLHKAYIRDNLVLFLGAGVSVTSGISTWDNLVSDLFVSLISEELKEKGVNITESDKEYIINQLIALSKGSPLLQARYIRNGLEKKFEQAVSQALYKGVSSSNETSALIESISKLCLPRRSGIGVRAVVTYNFDDILEKSFEKVGINYTSVYRDNIVPDSDELGIYHVHGFLPRNTDGYDRLSESLLIFSEEGYHSLYLDPYAWSNITQLNYLRENTCVMIGLSLSDPNLRRLLEIASSKRDSTRHFVILKRQTISNLDNNDDEIISIFSNVNEQIQEKSLMELGLDVIWVENYDDIPKIINSIKNRIINAPNNEFISSDVLSMVAVTK